jgi:hypothetical protein
MLAIKVSEIKIGDYVGPVPNEIYWEVESIEHTETSKLYWVKVLGPVPNEIYWEVESIEHAETSKLYWVKVAAIDTPLALHAETLVYKCDDEHLLTISDSAAEILADFIINDAKLRRGYSAN